MKKNLFIVVLCLISFAIGIEVAKKGLNNPSQINESVQEVVSDNAQSDEQTEVSQQVTNIEQNNDIKETKKCVREVAGLCILTNVFVPTGLPCKDYESYLNLKKGCYHNGTSQMITDTKKDSDRWVGAMVECKRMGGHLPDETEMNKLASVIYDKPITTKDRVYSNYTEDENGWQVLSRRHKEIEYVLGMSFPDPDILDRTRVAIWSSVEASNSAAYYREFSSIQTYEDSHSRKYKLGAICIAD